VFHPAQHLILIKLVSQLLEETLPIANIVPALNVQIVKDLHLQAQVLFVFPVESIP